MCILGGLPSRAHSIAFVVLCLAASACGGAAQSNPPLVQPGAPGEATRVIGPGAAMNGSSAPSTDADIRFMQGMIAHHAQAVEMSDLVDSHTSSADMHKLAQRIQASQTDEIKMMEQWLAAHGQEVPSAHTHHAMDAMLMPGMLTSEEMARLSAAKGREFDRLFLEGMIKHHQGALVMVKELFATPGAGQDSDVFAFASDVDADQRMEIDRMRSMLTEYQQ